MGREIRKVKPGWEHPRYTEETATSQRQLGQFRPLYDNDYESAAEKWITGFNNFKPDDCCKYFWEYDSPPDAEMYRAEKWTPEEATCWQVYETVSEGTPVTPVFATAEELIDYLSTKGDFWDQSRGDAPWTRANAEAFVKHGGWAPSGMMVGGKFFESKETPMAAEGR